MGIGRDAALWYSRKEPEPDVLDAGSNTGKERNGMDTLLEKFAKLGCDNAPGQESRQKAAALELRGEKL